MLQTEPKEQVSSSNSNNIIHIQAPNGAIYTLSATNPVHIQTGMIPKWLVVNIQAKKDSTVLITAGYWSMYDAKRAKFPVLVGRKWAKYDFWVHYPFNKYSCFAVKMRINHRRIRRMRHSRFAALQPQNDLSQWPLAVLQKISHTRSRIGRCLEMCWQDNSTYKSQLLLLYYIFLSQTFYFWKRSSSSVTASKANLIYVNVNVTWIQVLF